MESAKVSGYLEKKGKLKILSYKKYWFVLEGRLLLYYRSKDEYEAISPCKGSINLGPPCAVKPCPNNSGVFQIETRTNTVILRAEDKDEQNRWMQAIMSALNQNTSPQVNRLNFRYSLDNVKLVVEDKVPKQGLIKRLQKLGAQSYGGSVGAISKLAGGKSGSSESLSKNFNGHVYAVIKSSSSGSVEYRKLDHLYDTIPPEASLQEVFIDNEQYCGVDQRIVYPNTDSEVIYTEPKYCEVKQDQNCNDKLQRSSFLVDNVEYSHCQYEYLDLKLEEPKKKLFRSFRRKIGLTKSFDDSELNNKTTTKVGDRKKSQSFIKKVWSRRKPRKEYQEEDLYETVPDEPKTKLSNEGTIQMLCELQNILQSKKPLVKEIECSIEKPQVPPKTHQIAEPPILRQNLPLTPRHSDELTHLLNELTKVTQAPILPSSTTNSLISPINLTDEELLQLIPIRKRRLSEPDYDVPRSHKSLQTSTTTPPSTEPSGMVATRFFGPILPESISPDSLEPDLQLSKVVQPDPVSYSSHNYARTIPQEQEQNRSYEECTISCGRNGDFEEEDDAKSSYVDSLETATAF